MPLDFDDNLYRTNSLYRYAKATEMADRRLTRLFSGGTHAAWDLAESLFEPWAYLSDDRVGWTGGVPQMGQHWASDIARDHQQAQFKAIRETVCSVVGHSMRVIVDEFAECSYCSYVPGCGCCDEDSPYYEGE